MVTVKRLTGQSVGEDVGFLHKASEIVNWHNHFVKKLDSLFKSKHSSTV